MHVPNAVAVQWDTSPRRAVPPVEPGLLQVLQFPAKTELKEAHHGHGSAAGLEALAGSQHMLLSHPTSMLGTDHFSHWPQQGGDAGVQAGGSPGPAGSITNPGNVTTSASFGGCRGFVLNQTLAPLPRGVIAVRVPPTLWGRGHLGSPRLRRKLRPGAENKIPFFVGKCSDLKWSDSLISGFESHTLIICQD